MSKFKIIEASRFSKKEMDTARGGYNCPGTFQTTCVNVHSECISVPANYVSDLCTVNHGVCGLGAVYREYCVSVHQSCGLLSTYSF